MYELIRENQLNLMLLLCGACGILILLLVNTRFLKESRKKVLILIELIAFFLLWFDRLAYVYAGVPGDKAYFMVRFSNFMVFFLTSGIVFGFNLYLINLLTIEGELPAAPRRLQFVGAIAVLGMVLAVISAFTGLYYYFDENNLYHRGPGFLVAYIIPVLGPLLQYTVIRQYKKKFSTLIYLSLLLYIFVPIGCGILQIFTYGISIVNMAMVAVSVSLYIFMYLDLNNTVEHAHEIEILNMQGEQSRMHRLFDQTATAFVLAVEKKDDYVKGNSMKVAHYARKIAELAGKSEEDCEKVYYTALLHDVGLIGVPDQVIKNDGDPDKRDYDAIRQKPVIGAEILSSITEYPYLKQGARYSHERFNGTGYPEGLRGEDIPDIARIVGVADAYVTMTTRKRYRDARQKFEAREALIQGAGEKFDPFYADLMVRIIDSEYDGNSAEAKEKPETEITCMEYREHVSGGISVEPERARISFDFEALSDGEHRFSAASVVLFDAYDSRVHDNPKAIDSYHYLEYGEIWFDRHSITTGARRIVENIIKDKETETGRGSDGHYEIEAGRYEDHLKLVMRCPDFVKEVIVALPDASKGACIGITGEMCHIRNITVTPTGETVKAGDIPRIVDPLNFIDHLEADIPNVQVDRTRSASTPGIEIGDRMTLEFHTTSLPGANLVWHCPYIILFASGNGMIGGEDYRELAVIKLNGENNGSNDDAQNRFVMKRKEDFPGWDAWKAANKKGLECRLNLERKGSRILLRTENLGIALENTMTLLKEFPKVYVALTGDQVALTDIRINRF